VYVVISAYDLLPFFFKDISRCLFTLGNFLARNEDLTSVLVKTDSGQQGFGSAWGDPDKKKDRDACISRVL